MRWYNSFYTRETMQLLRIFFALCLLTSCNLPHKCCPDQFKWTFNSQHIAFNFNLAMMDGDHLYGTDGEFPEEVGLFNTRESKWYTAPQIPTPVKFETGVQFNHFIYLMGGMNKDSEITSAFQKLDLSQNLWTTLPNLPMPVSKAASVIYKNKIYLIGGITGTSGENKLVTNSLQVYDPSSGIWQKKSSMPVARYGHSAIVVNDKIIVAGGSTEDNQSIATVIEYNPDTDHWSQKADVVSPMGYIGLFSVKGRIYGIFGKPHEFESRLIHYDPDADQWTDVGNVPERLTRFGITSAGDHVYIIGGQLKPNLLLIGKKLN
ncbi:MAG: kelch repeat-containing protein [Saprospiraceae bacterium]